MPALSFLGGFRTTAPGARGIVRDGAVIRNPSHFRTSMGRGLPGADATSEIRFQRLVDPTTDFVLTVCRHRGHRAAFLVTAAAQRVLPDSIAAALELCLAPDSFRQCRRRGWGCIRRHARRPQAPAINARKRPFIAGNRPSSFAPAAPKPPTAGGQPGNCSQPADTLPFPASRSGFLGHVRKVRRPLNCPHELDSNGRGACPADQLHRKDTSVESARTSLRKAGAGHVAGRSTGVSQSSDWT
jgi:hypothetical protein